MKNQWTNGWVIEERIKLGDFNTLQEAHHHLYVLGFKENTDHKRRTRLRFYIKGDRRLTLRPRFKGETRD